MRSLVTGATGFVGKRLLQALELPVVLSRDAEAAKRSLGAQIQAFAWEPEKSSAPAQAFHGVDTVFHLAGDPVAQGRWTTEKKRRIRDSRVLGTKNLVDTMLALAEKPKVLVSASAVGIYGSRGEEILTERSSGAQGYLADVCREWEEAAARASEAGIRVVSLRIGIVLGPGGGAISRMLPPFRLGVGGPLGNGKQWMPWIHLDDVVGMMLHAAAHPEIHGPMNAAAPGAVTNKEFSKILGSVLSRPAFLPAPAFALRLALGEFADVLLASQRVLPRVAKDTGYNFRYPELEPALRATLSS